MKKITFILLLLVSFQGFSQNITKKDILEELQKTEDSKSGNYKDLFNSFYQLATKNITGDHKSIEFNGTLFQIKANANEELMEDVNFKNERFSRNFQINLKLNLNEDFKYDGFAGGFTYAIINKRDKQIAVLTNSLFGKSHDKLITVVENIQSDLLGELNDSNRVEGMAKIESATESILNGKPDTANEYYDKIISAFAEKTKESNDFEKKELTDFIAHLQNLKTDEYHKIDAKPLWTISADGTADKEGKFNSASIGSVFLKGNAAAWNEIDIRAKLSYNDTITINPMPRTEFKSTVGVNFKIAKSKENVSFFEVKAALEYNYILKNPLVDEKKSYFLGNAEIRVRLTDDLWLPIIIKYDIENANFLGFLNLSYNFGGFKQSKNSN
jgi:hypothetical protein